MLDQQSRSPGEAKPGLCRRSALMLLSAAPLLSRPVVAQSAGTYPNRTVKVVVSGTPGTPFDTISRMITDWLAKEYGVPFVVENRTGGMGQLGNIHAARQPPDGYTLVAGGLGPMVIAPAVYRNFPLDVTTAFVPIARTVEQPTALAVPAASRANTLHDLVEMAKARPGDLNVGTNNIASSPHMAFELFANRTGTRWLHVPYAGSSEVITGLLSNTVDVGFTQLSTLMPLVESGRLRVLGVTTARRSHIAPNIPTFQEFGIAGYEVSSWLSMHGIAGTPAPIIEKLSRDIIRCVNDPEVRSKLEAAGYTVNPAPSAELAVIMERERQEWSELARAANISIDFRG